MERPEDSFEMEESAPKRRRTSPRTSVGVDAAGSITPNPSLRRKRPSFASPTKASLARHNPEILERRRSRSPEKGRSMSPQRAASSRRQSEAGSPQSLSDLLMAQLDSEAERLGIDDILGGFQQEAQSSSSRGVRQAGGGLAAPARRSPSKNKAAPLASTSQDTGDVFNPFMGRRLRRSPGASAPTVVEPESVVDNPFMGRALRRSPGIGVPRIAEPEAEPVVAPEPEAPPTESKPFSPEPELPLTEPRLPPTEFELPPAEPALPSPEPPLSSPEFERPPAEPQLPPAELELPPAEFSSIPDPVPTPSPKTANRSSSRWNRTAPDNSPLKQPPQRVFRKPDLGKGTGNSAPKSMAPAEVMEEDSPFKQPAQKVPQNPDPRKAMGSKAPKPMPPPELLEEVTSAVARRTRSFDPDFKRKRERDELKKQVEEMKKDLAVLQRENERIRLQQLTGRNLALSNPDGVLEVLLPQLNKENDSREPKSTQHLLKAALDPGSLLPFGKQLGSLSSKADVEEKPSEIRSHHPVLMTAQEELPYLQLFSAFTAVGNIALLPPLVNEPVRQLHSITLQSREIPGIFTSKIDMVVNAVNLTILDLNVPAIEPSARAELRPFVEKLCTGECNRSMQRNIGIICWAMGEWVRVATERAAFWYELEQKLGTEKAIIETTQQIRTKKSRRGKGSNDDVDDTTSSEKGEMRRADLLRLLGQQHYDISLPNSTDSESTSTVRFQWKAEFDWTGEAKSKLAVMVGVPGTWHHLDERGSFGSLPGLFDTLVNGGEKLETAVHTIAALVVGEVA